MNFFHTGKVHTMPDHGEMCSRKHYTGFWLRMRFFWPVEIE